MYEFDDPIISYEDMNNKKNQFYFKIFKAFFVIIVINILFIYFILNIYVNINL